MQTPNTIAGAVTEDVMARVRRNLPEMKTHEYNRTYEAVLESMREHWPEPSQTEDVIRRSNVEGER
jgi:hypothetical protein